MSVQFIPRLSAPSTSDLNWIGKKFGGHNSALVVGRDGSVLPNCCGFVHGRWLELGEDESRLCLNNAWVYWSYNDGYKRGQVPKLGAILVWSCTGKAGHVAICEKIHDNGTVTISNSNYSGTRFYTKVVDPHKWPSGYSFSGYIYPEQDFVDTIGTPVPRDESRDQIQVLIKNLNARSFASINADRLGYMTPGIYNILGTAKAGSYTWYNVEPNVWFAYGKGWCDLLPASQAELYDISITGVSKGDCATVKKLCDDLVLTYSITKE